MRTLPRKSREKKSRLTRQIKRIRWRRTEGKASKRSNRKREMRRKI